MLKTKQLQAERNKTLAKIYEKGQIKVAIGELKVAK